MRQLLRKRKKQVTIKDEDSTKSLGCFENLLVIKFMLRD